MTTSAPYYGDSAVMRTPPPDLPSLLLKERIVYLGLPLFSDDDAKRQMGIDVTELIIAQLLYSGVRQSREADLLLHQLHRNQLVLR